VKPILVGILGGLLTVQLAAAELDPPVVVRTVAFSFDGKLLAAGFGDRQMPGGLAIWSVPDRRALRRVATSIGVSSVAFSPDGRLLAWSEYDQPPKVLDLMSGEIAFKLDEPCRGPVEFSPDGTLLGCASSDKVIRLFDVESRQEKRALDPAKDRVYGRMSFSSDGGFLIAPCGSAPTVVWTVATGQPLREFAHGTPGAHFVRSAGLSRDGKWVATGGYDGTARLWNLSSGVQRLRLSGLAGIESLDMSRDASLLAITSGKEIWIFRLWLGEPPAEAAARAGDLLRVWETDDYLARERASREMVQLGFAAEPLLVQAAADSPLAEIRIRSRYALQEILSHPAAVLRGHESDVMCVAFSPDGQTLATAADDGSVRLWSSLSFQQVAIWTLVAK